MRNCDGCTKCCEGWLTGTIHGKSMWPGKPCHFVQLGKGCSIYEARPDDPCKSFICEWKRDFDIPEWLKPSLSNVIIRKSYVKISDVDVEFIQVIEAGSVITSQILNWIFLELVIGKQYNVRYMVNGCYNHVGSREFVNHFNKK